MIKKLILPAFSARCASTFGADNWALVLDPKDPDQQTILFTFPNAITTSFRSYMQPIVKIELGARSDHWPVERATVHPYLSDALPNVLIDASARIKVLAAERTFWEKATILHMLYHFSPAKIFPIRMSRHYYDFYMLLNSPFKDIALKNVDLLARVAKHKGVFFRAASAKYGEAQQGTLRLLPPEMRKTDLKSDYAVMAPMFFDAIPAFETIMADIAAFESTFNRN